MDIRTARSSDTKEIARLSAELGYPANNNEIAARLAKLLGQTNCLVIVAQEKDDLCGWITAERRLLLESGEKIEITGLIVDTKRRRTGVGRRLVEEVEKWADGQGVHVISVRSNIAREESHIFYESLGFIRKKTQHAYQKST